MIGVLHFNLWHIFKQKTIYKDLKDRFDTLETSSGALKGYKLTHYTLFAYLIQNQRVKPVSCGSGFDHWHNFTIYLKCNMLTVEL